MCECGCGCGFAACRDPYLYFGRLGHVCVFHGVFISKLLVFDFVFFVCARSGTVVIRSSRLPGLIGLHDGVDRAYNACLLACYKVFRKQL